MSLSRLFIGLVFFIFAAGSFVIESMTRPAFAPQVIQNVDLESASKINAGLKNTLRWSFGGKVQRGWYLYAPLIKKTLATEHSEDSIGFAGRVYEWQRDRSLAATGIIDRITLFSFIDLWQSKRIKPIILAREAQLISAPVSFFFDQTRQKILLKVERSTFAAYQLMISEAFKDESLSLESGSDETRSNSENYLKIISSYRSPAYQAELRKRERLTGSAQLAYTSAHFTGRALDLYVGGEPVSTRDSNRAIQIETPVYKWLVRNAERFGFYPYFYEPWHWEYVPENNPGL